MKRIALVLAVVVGIGLVGWPGSALSLSYVDPDSDVDPNKPPLHILTGMTADEFKAMFDPNQPVDNRYFPLTDTKSTRIFESDDGEERFELTNIGSGKTIMGVETTTQLDRAYEEGLLVEETYDYYAQDKVGRVWYMGEDVTNYEYDDDGNLIGKNDESAWIADGEESLPGWMMLKDPDQLVELRPNYYQEIAPLDEALDEATVWALIDEVILGNGEAFYDVLQVLEKDPYDDEYGYKYYAPGFGLIMEEEELEALEGDGYGNPGRTFEYVGSVPAPVPEPGTIFLLGTGILGMIGVGRKKSKK